MNLIGLQKPEHQTATKMSHWGNIAWGVGAVEKLYHSRAQL